MKDLTHLKTFIIDSNDPKEIDDAVSLEIQDDEITKIWIHISYPVKLFEFNSKIDLKARKNSSSIYLIDKYISMLPLEIIEESNLKQNKLSETISACIELRENGSIKRYQILEALIKPNYELTYDDANDLLELEPSEEYELIILNKLLKKSLSYRKENGALIFNTPYSKIIKEDNNIIFEKIELTEAHKLISEAMILMGYVISDFLLENKISAPFRSQKINCDVNQILLKNSGSLVKYSILKQYIGKSFISIKANKHETLGLKSYVQSTSPLRRYLDLIVQRQLDLYLNNQETINEDTINKIIDENNIKQKEIYNIIKDNKLIYLRDYFKSKKTLLFKIIFIRWVNYKKNIALVYFPDYYLEILINLYISIDTYTNKIYSVKYNTDSNSNLLEFTN